MQEVNFEDFVGNIEQNQEVRKPLSGQIELTYRCNLNCIHCYCKGSEDKNRELSVQQWKDRFDEIHREGCLWLTFTGGEPILRDDFLELYAYARKKGFLISLFTNGTIFPLEVLKFFKNQPPFLIEITLYGITKEVYESITQVSGSFELVKDNINKLLQIKMPVVLKTVGLKQNKDEILKVKTFSERLLGKNKFKFDIFILSRLNGDTVPCRYRLSPEEILEIENSDPDIIAYRKDEYHRSIDFKKSNDYLYQCNVWLRNFFINPYGQLQFCSLTQKYSTNLLEKDFKEGFYQEFPKLLNERFKTNSKCKDCNLRETCFYCPVRTYLETGNEEEPVEYYCQTANIRQRHKEWILYNRHGK